MSLIQVVQEEISDNLDRRRFEITNLRRVLVKIRPQRGLIFTHTEFLFLNNQWVNLKNHKEKQIHDKAYR